MADTMQFDLVSPERSLLSAQASSVSIPGSEGDLTAGPGHEPTITTLRPGILTVVTEKGTEELEAKHIVLATGARARELPGLEADGKRVWTYRHALQRGGAYRYGGNPIS